MTIIVEIIITCHGKTVTGKTSAFNAIFTRTSWFLRNGLTGRRSKPQVDGLKIIEVRITGYFSCVA